MRKYKLRREKPLLPPVDIQDMKRCFFVYGNEVYSVKTAPDAVFRSAVLAIAPYWLYLNDEHGPLLATEMDLWSRWYLLCELTDTDRPMPLYTSRESAEQQCSVLASRV